LDSEIFVDDLLIVSVRWRNSDDNPPFLHDEDAACQLGDELQIQFLQGNGEVEGGAECIQFFYDLTDGGKVNSFGRLVKKNKYGAPDRATRERR